MMDRGEFANWDLDPVWDEDGESGQLIYEDEEDKRERARERSKRAAQRIVDAKRSNRV